MRQHSFAFLSLLCRIKSRVWARCPHYAVVIYVACVVGIYASPAHAQRIFVPPDATRDANDYVNVTLESDDAGRVSVRGDNILGIDWPAPARARVSVPLMVFDNASQQMQRIVVSVNTKPVTLALPVTAGRATTLPGVNADVYASALTGVTGLRATDRFRVSVSVLIVLLALGACTLAAQRYRVRLTLGMSILLGVGIAFFFGTRPHPLEQLRAVVRDADTTDTWQSITRAGPDRVRIPWSLNAYLVPPDVDTVRLWNPVLTLDAQANPKHIEVSLRANEYAIWMTRGNVRGNSDARVVSPRRIIEAFYRRPFTLTPDGSAVLK